jgi:catechol 2,3-dioxygenase-like lactoylglutathione lyase family enzyme
MTNIDLQFFPVTVDDVDAAIGFYSGALGLDVLNDVASDGHRWVTLGVKGRQGPNLVLSDPGAGRSAEDAEALHRLVAKGSGPGTLILVRINQV